MNFVRITSITLGLSLLFTGALNAKTFVFTAIPDQDESKVTVEKHFPTHSILRIFHYSFKLTL